MKIKHLQLPGTVKIMINGSIKLSNCAAKIKNINNKANPNANEVLELLSTKSLDSPNQL
jgi:hypothetical protein